jgi:cytochrome c peroxidase
MSVMMAPKGLRNAFTAYRHLAISARVLFIACIYLVTVASETVQAVNLTAPPSLKTVPVPEPPNLGLFLHSDSGTLNAGGYPDPLQAARDAAIVLGKALFWDMQVGSDGIQACATCHYNAGADNRRKGVLNPGLTNSAQDPSFQLAGNNAVLTPPMFPLVKFQDPEDRFSHILRNVNDVVSSPGIHKTNFAGLQHGDGKELGSIVPDGVFNVAGINVRSVPSRNAPTVINAVFNYANFWDGRASNFFNGVNPFGAADEDAFIYVNMDGVLTPEKVLIPMASLASQAVGPPLSDVEMSYAGRTFPQIGKKLLALTPLAKQQVHRRDSVLGPYASPSRGLNTTYDALIRASFQPRYWNSDETVNIGGYGGFTQMEANFSLFFGLAIQLYEATLVSDETPFDRFQEGDNTAMSVSAQTGLNIFMTDPAGDPQIIGGACFNCHGGSEFTNASVSHIGSTFFGDPPEMLIENMATAAGPNAFYDAGYYDIAVRPWAEDSGRGAADPFGYPLSFTGRALLADNGNTLPFLSPPLNPPLPCGVNAPRPCPLQASATRSSFKVPTLRNVELTGPYFHNGSAATLAQVMDLYIRGGNFRELNIDSVAPDINILEGLKNNPVAQEQLIDFLLTLTDDRVRLKQAPFDHPELFVPDGASGNTQIVSDCNGVACDAMIRIPAVGKFGLPSERRLPARAFMGLGLHQP